jgi:RHS repeat-associated protein
LGQRQNLGEGKDDYDLISGKVNRVVYQPGELDQFIHRYGYDGDNRITEVHTSHDGIVWTKEANYEYYAHGPLARIVFGEQNIETQDFAYTLQGWIKALNGQHFRYALGYFAGDYSSIGTTNNLATPIADNLDLYNGNIATMASLNPKLSEETWTRQFTYDQLNRITGSKSIGMTHTDAYKTSYTYDANGNIMSLNRFNEAGLAFDALEYHYNNKQNGYKHNTNKLRWVDDSPALSANHGEDLEDQDVDNYHYDEIGNLTSDEQEGIARIEWNIYGKVSHIIRTEASTDSNLEFLYDATGNRVAKIIKPKNANPTITYYIRDATGNVLSVYKKSESSYTPELAEQYIYGSSRIGILGMGNIDNSRTLGLRSYELTDHLGNVRVVLNDARNSVGLTSVTAAYDYYPFGMIARSFNPTGSRYGFNGMEKDDELEGSGNSYTTEFRQYDPRIGRWLSIDPLMNKYPGWSPYSFCFNNPIRLVDPSGADPNGEKPTRKDMRQTVKNEKKLLKEFKRRGNETMVDEQKRRIEEVKNNFKNGKSLHDFHSYDDPKDNSDFNENPKSTSTGLENPLQSQNGAYDIKKTTVFDQKVNFDHSIEWASNEIPVNSNDVAINIYFAPLVSDKGLTVIDQSGNVVFSTPGKLSSPKGAFDFRFNVPKGTTKLQVIVYRDETDSVRFSDAGNFQLNISKESLEPRKVKTIDYR